MQKHGIQSVRDIANNVLARYPNYNSSSPLAHDDGNIIRPLLLCSLIEVIIVQKQHEWCQQLCKLILTVKPPAKVSWIMAAPNEIKRVLSNLLNNAYEALIERNKGIIELILEYIPEKLQLHIQDNGIGIPSKKISAVLNGESLKSHGKGLGLSSAKQYMKNLKGTLNISSVVNQGTKVSLSFPYIEHIEWFSTKISIRNITTVIVLDNDFTTLMYWQRRIKEVGLSQKLFLSYNEAIKWVEHNYNQSKLAVFLVNYELAENSVNGLMFLEKIYYNDNRFLITNHAEKYQLQNQVKKAGVKIIPKILVNEISFIL